MNTHWRPIIAAAESLPYARCMCGKVFKTGPDADTYCSVACARADALKALMAGQSHYRQTRRNAVRGIREEPVYPEDEPETPQLTTVDLATRQAPLCNDVSEDSVSIVVTPATPLAAERVSSSSAGPSGSFGRAVIPRHPELPGRAGTPTRKGPPPPLQLCGPPSVPSSMVFEISPPAAPTTEDMPRSALFSELDADQAFVFISQDSDGASMAQDVWAAVRYLATVESPDARAHLQTQGSPSSQSSD